MEENVQIRVNDFEDRKIMIGILEKNGYKVPLLKAVVEEELSGVAKLP